MAVKNSSTRNIASGAMRKGHYSLGSGKMSKAHGVTNGGGKHKTLKNAENAVGGKCATFSGGVKRRDHQIKGGGGY